MRDHLRVMFSIGELRFKPHGSIRLWPCCSYFFISDLVPCRSLHTILPVSRRRQVGSKVYEYQFPRNQRNTVPPSGCGGLLKRWRPSNNVLGSYTAAISTLRRRPFKYKKRARRLRHRDEMRKEKYSYKIVSKGSTGQEKKTPREIYKMRPRRGKLYGRSKHVPLKRRQR